MTRLSTLFFGLFATFATGWMVLVGASYLQFGRLQPVKDEVSGLLVPNDKPGLARYGARVYAANGCVYCHTQQVKGDQQGSDLGRKWGLRRSVPRDYLWESPAFAGLTRFGPDLHNVGLRYTNANDLYTFLYDPPRVHPGSTQPPLRFLFRERTIQGEPSAIALKFASGPQLPPDREIVPSYDAQALVAYLMALKHPYALPEAPLPAEAKK